MNSTTAYAIKIKDRFYKRFGKNNRLQTAWCLAGAELFQKEPTLETSGELRLLKCKGIAYSVVTLGVA